MPIFGAVAVVDQEMAAISGFAAQTDQGRLIHPHFHMEARRLEVANSELGHLDRLGDRILDAVSDQDRDSQPLRFNGRSRRCRLFPPFSENITGMALAVLVNRLERRPGEITKAVELGILG